MKIISIIFINLWLISCVNIPYQEQHHIKSRVVDIHQDEQIDVYLQTDSELPIIVRIQELDIVEQEFIPGAIKDLQTNYLFTSYPDERKNGKVRLFSKKKSDNKFTYRWYTDAGVLGAQHDDSYIYQLPYPYRYARI